MAGAIHKTMVYLGLADGEDQYRDEERHEAAEAEAEKRQNTTEIAERRDEDYRAPVTPIKRAPSAKEQAMELRQINTIHPRSYNDAKAIGESFRDGIPVIMNVTDMGEADAKRLVDFSAGLVFGLHGNIERVTNKVFLLSPAYVEVLGEDAKEDEKKAAFFNQS